MTTTSTPDRTFDSELEGGAVAQAEQLLGPHDELTPLAERLEAACLRFDETKAECTAGVGRLEEIATEIRSAGKASREALAKERAEIVGQILHAPSDVRASAEDYVAALSAWAPRVHAIATSRSEALRRDLVKLEMQRNTARAKIDAQTEISPETAKRLLDAGLSVNDGQVEVGADDTNDHKAFRSLQDQIDRLRTEREPFVKLAAAAQSSLTRKFGEGYGQSNIDGGVIGRREYIDRVRHLTSRQVNPHIGLSDVMKPLNA